MANVRLSLATYVTTCVVAVAGCGSRRTPPTVETPKRAGDNKTTSGFIHTVDYGIDHNGSEVVGRQRKVWFREGSTRRDTIEGETVLSIQIVGPSSCVAYPGTGRIQHGPQYVTYPEEARRVFASLFSSRVPVRTETLLGLPCNVYSWHEEAMKSGCMSSPEHDVKYWVHANSALPIIMRYESSTGSGSGVREVVLGDAVGDDVFSEPEGLAEIIPFRLPAGDFVLEIQMDRSSDAHGWRSVVRESYSRNGGVIRYSHEGTSTHGRGARSKLPSVEKELAPQRASQEVGGRLGTPSWWVMKKVGSEPLLGLTADILVPIAEQYGDSSWWVADHPVFGTVTLKKQEKQETQGSVTVVTKLVVE